MKRKIDLIVDIKVKYYNPIVLKQFDTTEFTIITLDDGLKIDLSGHNVNLIFTKPNGTIVSQICNIDEDNKIKVTLKEDCVRKSGKANIEIEIKDANSNIASSFYIPVAIEQSSKENIESTNTPNYIEELDKTINDLKENATNLLQNIQQNGENTIDAINTNYASIVNNVNTLLENYNNIQDNVTSQIATAIGNINQFKVLVVEELPTENINCYTIYFLRKNSENEEDSFDEYMYINNKWELIGSTKIDLSNYVTKQNIKVQQATIELTETIQSNVNYTIPLSYQVSNNSLEVFYCGEKLKKGIDYVEVGESEEISNTIQFVEELVNIDMSTVEGFENFVATLEFVVRGDYSDNN